jgi:hypothetical protein
MTWRKNMADVRERDRVPPQVGAASMNGQNIGAAGEHPEKQSRTARDVKEVHARFADWKDDELDEIPVLPTGARLEQGATYLDLSRPQLEEFVATGGMEAGSGHCYVPKSDVPYQLWNRLLGRDRP